MRLRERVCVILLVFSDILVFRIFHCIPHTLLPFNGKIEIGERERERERESCGNVILLSLLSSKLYKTRKKCKTFDKKPIVTIKMCSERQKQRQADRQTNKKSQGWVPSHESLDTGSTKGNSLIGLFNPDQADS